MRFDYRLLKEQVEILGREVDREPPDLTSIALHAACLADLAGMAMAAQRREEGMHRLFSAVTAKE